MPSWCGVWVVFDFSLMDPGAGWLKLGLTLQDPVQIWAVALHLATLSPDSCLTLQDTMWLPSAMQAVVLKGR